MNASTLVIAATLAAAATPTGAASKEGHMRTEETARRAAGPGGLGAEVETDNDEVTVIRFRMAPHQKIPMHEVTPRAVVWLTAARLRLTFPDGSIRDLDQKAGDTGWLPRQRHAGENLGDAPIEFVAVVPKPGR
jgi:quercetin dioxygenase-like cupin family protein